MMKYQSRKHHPHVDDAGAHFEKINAGFYHMSHGVDFILFLFSIR